MSETFEEYLSARHPIPMGDIRPEVRKLAVAWAEANKYDWIGDKVKLASDIQHYADWYKLNKE